MASVADFQTRFPEFCEEDDDRVQLFLDDAALLMASEAKWIGFYDVAHAYHAAHLLVVALRSESGDSSVLAPVSHKEVDDVVIKRNVGDVSPTAEDLTSTTYGKNYMKYRKICFSGPIGA